MALGRLAREAGLACGVMALAALALWPGRWQVAAGVVGGGLLMALSAWAIRGFVDGVLGPVSAGAGRPRVSVGVLVKFFTRHAILALAAYGMMVRLHLDPLGMLAGVSSLAIAAGLEALRRIQPKSS